MKHLRFGVTNPSSLQTEFLKRMLAQAKSYDGGWEFPWLISSWDSPIWHTTAGEKTRKDDAGNWIDTEVTSWDVELPDGCRLTDDRYAILLESCRRVSALYRLGLVTRNPPSLSRWSKFNQVLMRLCNWLVLEKSRYQPAEYGFLLLDQSGIKRLLLAVAKGGWCEALSLIPRTLSALYERAFNQPAPISFLENPLRLSAECREKIVSWLSANRGFSARGRLVIGRVSRALIARLISTKTPSLYGNSQLDAFLRQFEIDANQVSLAPSIITREHPNQGTETVSSQSAGQAARGTVKETVLILRYLLSLYRHLPDRLPSPGSINLQEVAAIAYSRSSGDGHTSFIPVETGLQYLNHALRWVALYGDALVDYYLTVMQQLAPRLKQYTKDGKSQITRNYAYKKVFQSVPLPDALRDAGFSFSAFRPPPKDIRNYDKFRESPALQDALEVYIGAVVVVIALMKPSRDVEITSLPRVCLLRSRQGHYWLDSGLAKRTIGERRARTGGKPIPVITARAIQQVRKLNRGLCRIFSETDAYKRNLLFYIPSSSIWGIPVKMTNSSLNLYLDRFCDYVGLPLDEQGRRWYLRIHEMRKWFLLLLFWSGRYDVLDAARWIAGHTDVKHLYAYIEREFPDGKLGKLEAECAIDQLAKYDQSKVIVDDESIGLVELYQRLLTHFNVASLSFLKESEWRHLVEELFERDYHLEPYTVSDEHGDKRLCVAVRVGPRDDQNNE